VERQGVIQAALGKGSFTEEALLENIKAFMIALVDCKPEGFKGKYLTKVSLKSTQGRGVTVDLASVDPSNAKFMLNPEKLSSKLNPVFQKK